ncbi:MAG: PA14 domain-containing protein [Candidatus Nanohaloarchaea archaeon]
MRLEFSWLLVFLVLFSSMTAAAEGPGLSTRITEITHEPDRVGPGNYLNVTAEIRSKKPIERVDLMLSNTTIRMEKIQDIGNRTVWKASWKVTGTESREYTSFVRVRTPSGGVMKSFRWMDPSQTRTACYDYCDQCSTSVTFSNFITNGCSLSSATAYVSMDGDLGGYEGRSNIYADGNYKDDCGQNIYGDTYSCPVYGWESCPSSPYDVTSEASDDYLTVKASHYSGGEADVLGLRTTLSWSEQCNSPPSVSNPRPAQATSTSPVNSQNPQLKVDVSDSNGDSVDVKFYNAGGSTGYVQGMKVMQWDHSRSDGANSMSELSARMDDGSQVTGKFGEKTVQDRIDCGDGEECNLFASSDTYSTCITGYIYAPESGTYSFATDSDDASDFFIDVPSTAMNHCDSVSSGNRVASWYGSHGDCGSCKSYNGQVSLSKGYHSFMYRMSDRGGGDDYKLFWMKPSDSSYSYVPASRFYRKSILRWDRESRGDTLTDLRDRMNQDYDWGLMYDHQSNYLRWAESDSDGRMKYSKNLPPNNGNLVLDLHFRGESYEASGVYFWAEDSSGNQYVFRCDNDGAYDSFSCGQDSSNFEWNGQFSVNAPNELTRFYMASDMENSLNEWWDRSQLYRMNLRKSTSLIGTDTVSGSGTASVEWSNLQCGKTYNWYVEADDGSTTVTSSTWTFTLTCNKPPKILSLVFTNSTTEHSYSVAANVYDPDGEGDIQSCGMDATSGGNTVSYSMNIDTAYGNSSEAQCIYDGVNYRDGPWAHLATTDVTVTATDSEGNTATETGKNTFPNHAPSVSSFFYSNYSTRHAFNVSAVVYDSDANRFELDRCEYTFTDTDGNSYSRTVSVNVNYGETDQGRCSYSEINTSSSVYPGFEVMEPITVDLTVYDDHGATGSASSIHRIPNQRPIINLVSPADDSSVSGDVIDLQVDVSDMEDAPLKVWFFNQDTGDLLGYEELNSGIADASWGSVEVGQTYEWFVKVSDSYENATSATWKFVKVTSQSYRTRTDLRYRYSTIITSTGRTAYITLEVENLVSESKQLQTSLAGVNAKFLKNDQDSISYTLSGGEEKSFQIGVSPTSNGEKTLRVITRNTMLGTKNVDRFPVYVTDFRSLERSVPGMGYLQLVTVVLVAATVYFYSLP